MTYVDWFVACLNQLTPAETSAFISTLAIIRTKKYARRIRENAIYEVMSTFDPTMQAYVLPDLVAETFSNDSELSSLALRAIERICSNSMPAYNLCRKLYERNINGHINRFMAVNAIKDINNYQYNSEDMLIHPHDYTNLNNYVMIILVLAAVKELILSASPMNMSCETTDFQQYLPTNLLEDALDGLLGRYPMLLAYQITVRIGSFQVEKPFKETIGKIPYWFEQPDLIETYLLIRFRDSIFENVIKYCFEKSVFDEVKSDLLISTNIKYCESKWLYDQNINCTEKEYQLFLNQLWQYTLCILIITQYDDSFLEFSDRLSEHWDYQVVQNISFKSFYLLSPWMKRKDALINKSDNQPFIEYENMQNQNNALLAGLSVPILSSIISNCENKVPEFLLELLLNLLDALGSSGVRQSILTGYWKDKKSTDKETNGHIFYFSKAVIPLLAFARDTVSYIGKGYLNDAIPQRLYQIIQKYSVPLFRKDCNLESEQKIFLHGGPSLMACSFIINEVLSGWIPGRTTNNNAWLIGGNESYAAKICEISLNEYWHFYQEQSESEKKDKTGGIKYPVFIAYQLYPEIIPAENKIQPDDISKIDFTKASESSMLLYQYEPAEWINRALNIEKAIGQNRSSVFTALALKIKNILTLMYTKISDSRDIQSLTDSINDWIIAISKIDSPASFFRPLRFVFAEVLSVLDEKFNTNPIYYENCKDIIITVKDIAQSIIETVADYSRDTVFYQWIIAKTIYENKSLTDTTRDFCALAFMNIILNQMYDTGFDKFILRNPWQRDEANRASSSRDFLALWFLYLLSDRFRVDACENGPRDRLCALLDKHRRYRGYIEVDVYIRSENIQFKLLEDEVYADDNSFLMWDPDTLRSFSALEKNSNLLELKTYINNEAHGRNKIIPIERSFIEFLVEQYYAQNCETIRLTYIDEDDESVLLCASPGYNYRLFYRNWDDTYQIMLGDIQSTLDGEEPQGVYLYLTVVELDELPKIHYSSSSFENIKYRQLFKADNIVEVLSSPQKESYVDFNGRFIRTGRLLNNGHYIVANSNTPLLDQRKGHINVSKPTRKYIRNKDSENIEKLIGMKRGDIWEINTCRLVGQPLNLYAWHNNNAVVNVSSDSVSLDLAQLETAAPQVKDIVCLVTNNPYYVIRPNAKCGVVCSYEQTSKDIDMQIEVAYLEDKQVKYDYIPESSFSKPETKSLKTAKRTVNIGTTISYVNDPNGDFQILSHNDVFVRRLWKKKEPLENSQISVNQVYLGEVFINDGKERRLFGVQDALSGELYLYNNPPKEHINGTYSIDTRYATVDVNPIPVGDIDKVAFKYEGSVYWGDATRGTFHKGDRCSEICLKLEPYIYNGIQYYDIRRIFSGPISNVSFQDAPSITKLRQGNAKKFYDAYIEWQHTATDSRFDINHVSGKLDESDPVGKLKLIRPVSYLPQNWKDVSASDFTKWMPSIDMVGPVTSIIPDAKYDQSLVCAKLLYNSDGSLNATTVGTEPFNLFQMKNWLDSLKLNQNEYQTDLFYIDNDGDFITFEWGYGLTLKMPKDDLVDESTEPWKLHMLFFGDKIKKFRIIPITNNGMNNFILQVSSGDIVYGLENRINRDSCENILQFIKVQVNKETSNVSILKTTETAFREERKIDLRRTDLQNANFWKTECYTRGEFDIDSQKVIRNFLPDGGEGWVLARLIKSRSENDGLSIPKLLFEYVDHKSIRDMEILCLFGSEITQKAPDNENEPYNDYFVAFTPRLDEAKLLETREGSLNIRIYRRQISFNESILRVFYTQNKLDIFEHNFLVYYEKREDTSNGSLWKLPARPKDLVKKWLEKTGTQIAISNTGMKDKDVKIEIKPGVLCFAIATADLERGTIVELFIEEDTVKVRPISIGDAEYAIDGRVVELLLLDNVFDKKAIWSPYTPQFTVAGLPQLKLTTSNPNLCNELKHRYPPRYGQLIDASHVDWCDSKTFGRVLIIDRDIKLIRYYENPPERPNLSKLTFFDESITKIKEHILRGRWHIHDDNTVVINPDGIEKRFYYNSGESQQLHVVFSSNWQLRYPEGELNKYLLPPHEIQEYGFSNMQYSLNNRYPIAGTSERSIIVELSPGRVVEIPLKSLFVSNTKIDLREFYAPSLHVGDVVQLTCKSPVPGEPITILTSEIEYGMRSLIKRCAFLPFLSGSSCLILGGGVFTITYPYIEQKVKSGLVKLNQDNTITRDLRSELPATDDLVFLFYDNSKAQVVCYGFDNIKISLAADDEWNDCLWLKARMEQEDTYSMFGGFIPVIVKEATDHMFCVYYPQPLPPSVNKFLYCSILKADADELILRSGAYLFRVNVVELLSLQPEQGKTVAFSLEQTANIWLRTTIEGYKSGLSTSTEKKRQVRLKQTISQPFANGFICEDIETLELFWLPVERACRASGVLASDIEKIIFHNGSVPIAVTLCDDSCVSYLLNNTPLTQEYNNLKCERKSIYSVLVHCKISIEDTNSGIFHYLCQHRPNGNLYHMQCETKVGAVEDVFCEEKSNDLVVVVPCNQARTPIALSQNTFECLIYDIRGEHYQISKPQVISKFKKQHKKYDRALEESDARIRDIDLSLLKHGKQICNAIQLKYGPLEKERIDLEKSSISHLECWLSSELSQPLSVSTIVALALSAGFVGKIDTANNLLESLSKYAMNVACEEYILENWLILESNFRGTDLRLLLDTLNLRGENIFDQKDSAFNGSLTQKQTKRLADICGTVLNRLRDESNSTDAEVAMCLLYAVNLLDPKYEPELRKILSEKTKLYVLYSITKYEELTKRNPLEILTNSLLKSTSRICIPYNVKECKIENGIIKGISQYSTNRTDTSIKEETNMAIATTTINTFKIGVTFKGEDSRDQYVEPVD